MSSVLHDGLLALGFGDGNFSGIQTRKAEELEPILESYVSALQEYNSKFDLINTDEHDEIVIRHILDSLAAVPELCSQISKRFPEIPDDFVIADIGSGAGLPGIPLSAALPTFKFVCVERMTKRCGFLNHCKELLNLQNVSVEENQVERLMQKRFAVAVFRAFRPLEKKMTKVLLRILQDNGFLAAYKARHDKIAEEMAALPQNPSYSVVPLLVPFLTENTGTEEERERNLVIIEKA